MHSHTSPPFGTLPLMLETSQASEPLPSQLGLFLSPEAGPFLQHLPHSILSQVLASPKCKFSVSQGVLLVKGQGCLVLPESQTSSACEILSP